MWGGNNTDFFISCRDSCVSLFQKEKANIKVQNSSCTYALHAPSWSLAICDNAFHQSWRIDNVPIYDVFSCWNQKQRIRFSIMIIGNGRQVKFTRLLCLKEHKIRTRLVLDVSLMLAHLDIKDTSGLQEPSFHFLPSIMTVIMQDFENTDFSLAWIICWFRR